MTVGTHGSASLAVQRIPMLAIGMLSMAAGTWLGLVRIGWALPLPWPDQLIAHGPLMVCGFLGTLISLERAVALGSSLALAVPAIVAAGGLALVFHAPFASALVTAGSVGLVAVFAALLRRQPALYMGTMALGACAWVTGNVLWTAGGAIFRVVGWWLAFLILTIAGERLELNRVLRPTAAARAMFVAAVTIVGAGVVAVARWPEPGIRMIGAGCLALAGWLARYDIARRTVRQRGLTRFMAIGLLAGYLWLGIGGGIALASGVETPGGVYDAVLHAIFLGFVMSMVFAHAAVIFPAVLARPLPFRPAFYTHLALLHLSVALRVAGDLVETLGRWRVWGGLLNAAALAVFVMNTAWSIATANATG